jgi:PiT family inorganic phosphate transporter
MLALVLVLTIVLAFAHGANDVSKGIATLIGSGANYRATVLWGTIWTVAGAMTAAFGTQILVETFSGKGLLQTPGASPKFLMAIAAGATAWLLIATRTGLPVSTTHALIGALCGAAIASGRGVNWQAVAMRVALPLALSPLLSIVIVIAIHPLFRRVRFNASRPPISAEAGFTTTDTLHWLSAGATGFFRGMNDTPKIVALSAATTGIYPIIAIAMAAGSIAYGFRVTETLARRVTPIGSRDGFLANVVTSVLVAAASGYALPVSTTHVSTGAIVGIGAARGGSELRWKTVRDVLAAWIVTLPVAAILGGAISFALR